jgi:hypothetical protein
MSNISDILETVYASLHADNAGLDGHIATLKDALIAADEKTVEMEPERLPQNNRQGRKMLQTYFKKRGVVVQYAKSDEKTA